MTVKSIFLASFLVALLASGPAYADSHVLTVRQLPSAEYEAVITYDRTICGSHVNSATSVQLIGSEVRIESPPLDPLPCVGPMPPDFVEATANIGTLAPGNYTVSWVQPESFSLSTSLVVSALTQEGPFVPCVGCDTLIHAPFPETGSWYNPEQSGSGLNLEIQNGKLVGYYYGYDADGRPEWQLFTGMLIRSEQQGVQWELETPLLQFKNGNCTGCEYQPPEDPVEGATIRLEFQQRNYMRLTIGDNSSQFYVPIMYGSTGRKYFEEQTPYVFPEYANPGGGILSAAQFLLVSKPNADPPEPWNWATEIVQVGNGGIAQGGPNMGKLVYSIVYVDNSAMEPVPDGDIICSLDDNSGQPGCQVEIHGKNYIMPIGNLGDSRFFGEAEDGSTLEGIRLFYD